MPPRIAIVLLLCVGSMFAQTDPLSVFESNRLVTYADVPGSGYAREDFQWYIGPNTGQDSRLFLNGTYQSSEPGGTADIHAPEAWAIQPRADGVIVGIVDSGCDQHDDLAGAILYGVTFDDRHGTVLTNYPDYNNGHGTAIAGIIAAHRDNGLGIAGIADGCKLLIVSQSYQTDAIVRGIYWCVTNGANIICLSWGETSVQDVALSNACRFAESQDVIIVSAVANSPVNLDNPSQTTYPYHWYLPNLVEVCGTTREDALYGPTARGTNCIGAPSRIIVSTYITNGYAYSSGNSFASPIVTGVLALLKARFQNQDHVALIAALKAGCRVLPPVAGRIDALGALLSPVPSLSIVAGDTVTITLNGLPEFRYELEQSQDLIEWWDFAELRGNESISVTPGFYRARII